MIVRKLIAYYRVSTQRQGRSGLGLAAQTRAVEAYAKSVKGRIVASYTDVETGKGRNPNRPQLAAAIQRTKDEGDGAVLVIAKLDRLARNVAFTSALMEAKVPFLACDNPHADKLTIHILAAVAERESEAISERTKAALAEAKRRGKRLGYWGHKRNRRKRIVPRLVGKLSSAKRSASLRRRNIKASAGNQRKADKFAATVRPLILRLQAQGLSLAAVARALNKQGVKTRSGKRWTLANVSRVEIHGRTAAKETAP